MLENNVILVGFRGSNFLETGVLCGPYVPLIMTPLVYDPKNFTPRKGVMTLDTFLRRWLDQNSMVQLLLVM